MKRILIFTILVTLALEVRSFAETPPGFTWVNIEKDTSTMTAVRHALESVPITAIREVGVEGDYALVMAVNREAGAPTPDYDQWYIYNLSLKTGEKRPLVFGYGVKMIDWIGVGGNELAITYYHCWECEAATLFTTIRFTKQSGWGVRWTNKTTQEDYPQPGVEVESSDIDEEYDDVNQVFALVGDSDTGITAGSWFHARNTKTGKVENDVYKYWVDTITGADRVDALTGEAAHAWERKICDPSNVAPKPSIGQDSKACRSVMRTAAPKK